MCMTDVELHETIEHALSHYPALRGVLPADFPRATWCKVRIDQMVRYAEDRQRRYPHLLNLPLALHNALHADQDDVADVMQALLSTLDEFCWRFRGRCGAETLLAPLWEAMWTDTPEMWSIATCAFMANRLERNGKNVVGFEMPIGDPAGDARRPNSDIAVKIGERITHIEVQLWHSATFADRSDSQIRLDLERRATQKASKKLSALPAGDAAVIVDVVFVMTKDIGRDLKGFEEPIAFPDRAGAHWVPLRLVAVRDGVLRFDLYNF